MSVTLKPLFRRPRHRLVPAAPPSVLRVAAIPLRRSSCLPLKHTFFLKART
jgi:hypothetical protein